MIIDPAWWEQSDMRRVLAARDIGAVYRALRDLGITQRQIAQCMGQSQSEVSEITNGRVVRDYQVLERIADGLSIPRELIGLSWRAADGTYCGEGTVTELPEGVNAEMLRRHLLAFGATTVFGASIKGLGELVAQLPRPHAVSPPSQLFPVHVAHVRDTTRDLRATLLDRGSQLRLSSGAAAWADQLLDVSGPDELRRELKTAVAKLHILVAGWAALDAELYGRALYHYSRGLELATETGDVYLQAIALACSGLTMLEHGHPDEGLKMLQFAQVKAWSIPPEHDRKMIESCALADSAIAYAFLGDPQAAVATVGKSRQLWSPTRNDPRGDQDYVSARLEISRGRFETAEPFAVASVRRWEGVSELRRTQSAIMLATIHIKTGEPRALSMAHQAITGVTKLSSVQARTRLRSLTAALETRPGSDYQELARMAKRVATTRV
jgi:transcriptional regulator with XRE-family HTH domain